MNDTSRAQTMDTIFGRHMDAELAGDLDETMATMSENPHILNGPSMTGGEGKDGVRDFYANDLIGQFFPPDATFETISRTHGEHRLVDELVISFTHTLKMNHILPGVEPTGHPVSVIFVVIVGVEDDKISYEHIYWDQASILKQIGLLQAEDLPIAGREAADKLLALTNPR
jgi:carboxymethylenebutenolidase